MIRKHTCDQGTKDHKLIFQIFWYNLQHFTYKDIWNIDFLFIISSFTCICCKSVCGMQVCDVCVCVYVHVCDCFVNENMEN